MKSKSEILHVLRLYAGLVKYKLALAVAFSSATGYIIFSEKVDPKLLIVIAGVFLLASGSAALNQVAERIPDGVMERTQERPIPSGRLSIKKALSMVALLLIAGSLLIALANVYAFLSGILCIGLYNFLYTRLKPKSVLAIIPGALVGAIPPVIGFLAAGGVLSDPRIISFSLFMFLWQIPHFWILLLKYREDYNRAGFRTICLYLDDRHIRQLVLGWVLITSLFLLVFFGLSDIFGKYLARIIWVLNPLFIVLFTRSLFPPGKQFKVKSTFAVLNVFGLLVMISLIIDSLLL